MDLKAQYASNHAQENKQSEHLNKRLFSTYNRVATRALNKPLQGVNVDLGSGDQGFSRYCHSININSFPYDYPNFDIEKDSLSHDNDSVDFVTLNAVIEHIQKPENIFKEIKRILKVDGLVFIRTPNWKMDYKNFYNDPTHVKPYSPETLKNSLLLFGLECVFIEPGLIEKSWFWWKLPNKIKWKLASLIKGGTKSILCVATKIKE
ncbi:methyltransferase domain-containing protein [Psychromonas sp. MME2]|uniref:methyltransferase domain-containing protein n=1 Tax=unclassified Psychromonas TaxID=2614957 RepID=UPI00339C09F6